MAGDPGWLINRLNQVRADRYKEKLEPLGLSARSAALLKALVVLPQPVAQSEICEALVLDQASVAIIAESLESKGLIERVRDPRDRRRYAVTLTEAGAELQRESERRSQQVKEGLFEGMSPEDMGHLSALLTQLASKRGII
jgi:DNA-binding MarR family transcriptional regulator